MSLPAAGAIAGLAAGFGGMIAMIAFAPLTAVNNFLGSYYFGSGMILGERKMYQNDWIAIKKELDSGTPFINVLENVMKDSTQGVMVTAEKTLTDIAPEWNRIVLNYIKTLPNWILELVGATDPLALVQALIKIIGGENPFAPVPPGPGTEPPGTLLEGVKQNPQYSISTLSTLTFEEISVIMKQFQNNHGSTVIHKQDWANIVHMFNLKNTGSAGDIPTPPTRDPTNDERIILIFETKFVELFNEWKFWNGEYNKWKAKLATDPRNANFQFETNKRKNTTLDRHKKVMNHLTLGKNNPITRTRAVEFIKFMPAALS